MTYDLDRLRELIPLYLDKKLTLEEQKEFENGLLRFSELKRELMEFLEIKELYKEIEKEIPPPSGALYKRILRTIRTEAKMSLTLLKEGYRVRLKKSLKWFFSSPRVSWGIVAVQFAIILFLTFTILGDRLFTTLTTNRISQEEELRIHVVFDKESKEKEIREVLNRVGALIVRGPSPEGLYTIVVKGDQDIENVLEVLRKAEIVRFAEKGY